VRPGLRTPASDGGSDENALRDETRSAACHAASAFPGGERVAHPGVRDAAIGMATYPALLPWFSPMHTVPVRLSGEISGHQQC
jgi:hypothetical protein